MDRLTEDTFWDRYWENVTIPSCIDLKFSFDRCLAKVLLEQLKDKRGNLFEVGCAPGRWLAFLSECLGLAPHGIEYSSAGKELTKKNLEFLRLPSSGIINGDFFEEPPHGQFDVVLSLGFIEHFENPDQVVAKHLDWLKEGGTLVIGVPNFRGIYHPLQSILDRNLLEKHNLGTMSLGFFQALAHKFDLDIQYLSFLGSFEPALLIPSDGKRSLKQGLLILLIRICLRLRRFEWLDRFNHPLFSSYIMGVFVKRT